MVKRSQTLSTQSQESYGAPLSQILTELESPNKHIRGKALELLAAHFTRLIDLDFKGWLLRSTDSNSIEVDSVANDKKVPFNRWLIQCRNARQVDMEDIATAVGRGVSFRPSIMLSVTSGCFTQRARYYVARAMQLTNLRILLIDTHDLRTIAADEATIKDILIRETEQAKSASEVQVVPFYA